MTDASHPLDTATLGPIRVEPNAITERARVVREALLAAGADSFSPTEMDALSHLADVARDETLAELGRLLR